MSAPAIEGSGTAVLHAGSGRTRGLHALARCVGDVDAFFAQHWSQGPVHIRRPNNDDFADLFDERSLHGIIRGRELRVGRHDLRIVRTTEAGFEAVDPARYTIAGGDRGRAGGGADDVVDADAVWGLVGEGASIALQLVDRYWPPLGRFCRDLEMFLGSPCQATAYLTPAAAQGFDVHHDLHDVLVLSLAGTKQFTLYRPVIADPVAGQLLDELPRTPLTGAWDARLSAGDVLYMPRGTPHVARTSRSASLHVTIGIREVTWHAMARAAVEGSLSRLADDAALRRAVPREAVYGGADYARLAADVASGIAETIRRELVDAFADGPARALLMSRPRDYTDGGAWFDRIAARSLTPGIRVRLRPGGLIRMETGADGTYLLLSGGRRSTVPRGPARFLSRLAETVDGACPAEHPNRTEIVQVVRLVAFLLRQGVLEVAGDTPGPATPTAAERSVRPRWRRPLWQRTPI
ncbi:JmjC domain-containing protein [Embleya sp. NPDC001921]